MNSIDYLKILLERQEKQNFMASDIPKQAITFLKQTKCVVVTVGGPIVTLQGANLLKQIKK